MPPALEVVGPLEHPPTERQDDDVQNRGGRETVDPGSRATQKASVQTPDSGHITNPGAPRSSASGAAPRGEQERGATVPREGKGNDRPPLAARAAGQLMVFVGAETAWRNFEPEVRCDPGRYAVRVRIEGGVVRKVWPVWKPLAAPSESLMASQLVLGLEIDNVGDGEYPAEVVIEPRQPTSR